MPQTGVLGDLAKGIEVGPTNLACGFAAETLLDVQKTTF